MPEVRADVLASAERAAAKVIGPLPQAYNAATSRASAAGALGNSRTYLVMMEAAKDAYSAACEAAAMRVAEIVGKDAPAYADELRTMLSRLLDTVLSEYGQIVERHTARFSSTAAKSLGSEAVRPALAAALEGTIADLKVGIAGGANVDKEKSRIIHIDNRGGSGQFAVDSPGSQQSVGRDQTVQASSADELLQLVGELRLELTKSKVPAQPEIEDAAINLQRELQEEAPNPGRLKRLATAVGDFSLKVGSGAVGGFLARIAATAAGMP